MSDAWPRRSHVPPLPRDEIHVWLARLDSDDTRLSKWYRWLAPDEIERASRFHFARDERRYVARRAILRQILSDYVHEDPANIQFAYDSYGKPSLHGVFNRERLYFNSSHTGCLGLIGVSLDRDLGVDIEQIRPQFARETIPEQFFAASEVQALRALPAEQQAAAFFHCWTRKESYIKAIGKGLSQPLDRFEVSLRPGDPAEILRIQGDSDAARMWSLHAYTPTDDCVACVAVRDKSHSVRCWEWA